MKKAFSILFSIMFAFLCGSCLELEEQITLKQDGSLMASMTYSVPLAQMGALSTGHEAIASWQGDGALKANWFMDEKAVRSFFTHPEDGMNVLVYKKYQRNGRQYAEITVTAKNAAKALEQGYFGSFRLEGTSLTLHFPNTLDALPPEDIQRLRSLCGDLTIELKVQTPRTIRSTNGYKRKPNLAVWHLSGNGNGLDIFGKLKDFVVEW